MNIIKDLILVNKETSKRTGRSLAKNWPLFFTGLIYTVLMTIVYGLLSFIFVGPFALLGGMLSVVINSAFISNYLYLLFNIINYNRITVQNFKDGFSYFLRKIYGVFFIAYVVNIFMTLLNNMLGGNAGPLNIMISIFIGVFLNALPETVYQRSYNSMDSVSYALEFFKDNWFNWFIPNIVFFTIMYYLTGNVFGQIFATHISFNNIFTTQQLISTLLGQLIFTIGMIYRGHLFKILSTGSRRKREFMNQF